MQSGGLEEDTMSSDAHINTDKNDLGHKKSHTSDAMLTTVTDECDHTNDHCASQMNNRETKVMSSKNRF